MSNSSPNLPRRRELLETDAAAAYLGHHVKFVRRLIHDGELTAYVVGRRFMVDRLDLDAYLDQHRIDPWRS